MFRRLPAVAVLCALGACSNSPTQPSADQTPSYSASNSIENDVAVPFVRGVQIPCSRTGLEIAVFTGTEHVLIQQTVASTGKTTVKFVTNGQGITGVGLVSGDTYHLGGMDLEMLQLPLGTPYPATYSFINNFPITSAGPTGNIVAHETLRVDFDAQGNGTVTVVNFTAECK